MVEQVVVFIGFYQFNKVQLDMMGLDSGEEGIELVMVNIMYQYGIYFYFVKVGGEGGVNVVYYLVEFVLVGDGMELVGVEVINVDVNCCQVGIVLVFDIVCQVVIVGSDCNLMDCWVFMYGGNNFGEVVVQGGFFIGEVNFFGVQCRESVCNLVYFVYVEKVIVIDGVGFIIVWQVVGVMEVVYIGN